MADFKLQQRQKTQLSAQQVMSSQLLQLPLTQLDQRIYEELQENPMLELAEEKNGADREPSASPASASSDGDMFDSVDRFDRMTKERYKERESEGRLHFTIDNRPQERFFQAVQHDTFHEEMLRDFALREDIGRREVLIASEILGNLDSDGYLTEDIDVIIEGLESNDIEADEEEILAIQRKIWYLDPPGIATRSLPERLLIQLQVHERDHESEVYRIACKIISNCFDDFLNKRFDKLQKKLSIERRQLEAAIGLISSLDPHPVIFADEGSPYIMPDFVVSYENGELTASLNDRSNLSVKVSDTYSDVLSSKKTAKEDKQFLRQKLQRAREFASALQIRRQTLLTVIEALLQTQTRFFIDGPAFLQPLVMKTIAERTGLDISTISRAANGKYVQTRYGTFELKYFFSGSLSTDEGEELSSRIIKQQLRELITAEKFDNPLSDDTLAEMLTDKGIRIARRTVAKYREQMQIPVARLRKKIS